MATNLTPRQQEIVDLQKQGNNAKQIAAKLGITENAVYQQLRRARKGGAAKPKAKNAGRKSAAKPAASQAPAATPAPAAANRQVKSEPRVMTPLQAIRARRNEVAEGLREAEAEVTAAEKALKQATEARDKIQAKVTPELTQLDNAEAALKAVQEAAPAPEAPAPAPVSPESPGVREEAQTEDPAARQAPDVEKPAATDKPKAAAKPKASAKANGKGDAAATPKPATQAEREDTADDPFAEGEKAEAEAAQEAASA